VQKLTPREWEEKEIYEGLFRSKQGKKKTMHRWKEKKKTKSEFTQLKSSGQGGEWAGKCDRNSEKKAPFRGGRTLKGRQNVSTYCLGEKGGSQKTRTRKTRGKTAGNSKTKKN